MRKTSQEDTCHTSQSPSWTEVLDVVSPDSTAHNETLSSDCLEQVQHSLASWSQQSQDTWDTIVGWRGWPSSCHARHTKMFKDATRIGTVFTSGLQCRWLSSICCNGWHTEDCLTGRSCQQGLAAIIFWEWHSSLSNGVWCLWSTNKCRSTVQTAAASSRICSIRLAYGHRQSIINTSISEVCKSSWPQMNCNVLNNHNGGIEFFEQSTYSKRPWIDSLPGVWDKSWKSTWPPVIYAVFYELSDHRHQELIWLKEVLLAWYWLLHFWRAWC